MKLLHVIHSTLPESGGPITGLLNSSSVLLSEGHQIEVVSLDSPREAARHSFPFPVAALGRGIGNYGYNPRLVPWLRQQAGRFDAVILHGLWNYSSVGAWYGLRGHSTPYFIFPHGMMDPWFREQYPVKHIVKQVLWSLAEGRVLRDAKMVLFTSEEEKLHARNVFHGPSYNEQVVLYGAVGPEGDLATERAAFLDAFPALQHRRFLLFLGRIHLKKGCDLLIRAFAQSAEQLSPGLQLVIAGPDQTGWMRELKALAVRLGVAERIHWPGMLNGNLKWGALRSAEAFILPSHQENFGIVIAEAMACGTPVLISDKVNIWREVVASQGGFAAHDTVEGTQELFRRFYSLSPQERMQMGRDARQGFLQRFEVRAAAHDLLRLIGSVSAPSASSPLVAQ